MRLSRKILLLGTGGHCRSVADSLLGLSVYDEIGLVGKTGSEYGTGEKKIAFMGLPVVGDDDSLERLFKEGYTDAFVAVGSIGDVSARRRLARMLKKIGFRLPNIIDKSSSVSGYAALGAGIYVGKNAAVNAFAKIGDGSIINTGSIIEHQCVIGEFVHIATGALLCGDVTVGDDTHIGAGCMVKQGLHIGCGSMIGMGSVVLEDIPDHVTAYGNPCRIWEEL